MAFSLLPKAYYNSILDIHPEHLTSRGITLLLVDLDNTLVPYKVPSPTAELIAWREQMESGGVQVFLLSNSRKPTRPGNFAAQFGIDFIGHAGKPKRKGFSSAMERTGRTPAQTAIAGDQIFTDILGAKLGGVPCFLLDPIEKEKGKPFLQLRRRWEAPIRRKLAGREEAK